MNQDGHPSYAAFMRTHVWDAEIATVAGIARDCCHAGTFTIAANETHGPLDVTGFDKITHTADWSSFALPGIPEDRVLWWNGDYVLYAARAAMPSHEYYVMMEYDVLLNCDVDQLVARCAAEGIDLLVHEPKPIGPEYVWYPSVRVMTTEPWTSLLMFLIISGRAIDAALAQRRVLAAGHGNTGDYAWPFVEAFLPTAVRLEPGMRIEALSRFVDTRTLRFRPFFNRRDLILARPESISHPVFSGRRFIEAFARDEPVGALLNSDGGLRPELLLEELADLIAVLTVQLNLIDDIPACIAAARAPQTLEKGLINLAAGKMALQSSTSQWSMASTAAEDAGNAVGDIMHDDYAFHTNGEPSPWWQVDLGAECRVDVVEIVNRVNVPHNFVVFCIDASLDGLIWTTCFEKTNHSMVSSDPGRPARFRFMIPIVTRFVRIVQAGERPLHLRRVRVFGYPPQTQTAIAAED